MSLTKIGSIGINTGIAFAGVTTIVTLNTANDALSIGATVNVGSGITLGASGDIFATGVSTFSGNLKVGSGVTISPDGDGFYTGVVTATSFKGAATNLTSIPAANLTGTLPAISGANLTNLDASDLASGTVPTARLGSGTASSSTFLRGDSTFAAVTSTTINNNGNDRIITGSGTANTLEGESNLQFDGTDLYVSDNIKHLGDPDTLIEFSTDQIAFDTGGGERLRITSSGAVIVAGTSAYSDGTFGEAKLQFNTKSGNHIGACSVADTNNSVTHILFKNVQGTVGGVGTHDDDLTVLTGNTERLRITSDGKVVVGNNTGSGYNTMLQVHASGDTLLTLNSTSGGGKIKFYESGTGRVNLETLNGSGGLMIYNATDSYEIARFQSDDFLVGTTSNSSSNGIGLKLNYGSTNPTFNCVINQSAGNHSFYHLYNTNASHNAYRFYVMTNGGIGNHSGNNINLSDERMKKNITTMGSVYDTFKRFTFKDFNYIDDEASESKKHGLIAQDVETIDSDLISEDFKIAPDSDGNDVYRKALKEEQFMMIGMKALQEAITKIETLESRVAALEG